ncbi:MAG: hypothetical protein GXY33_21135 [Phycisphaerae bacterium]|nr:hypothetical protein [Phycisphaerae bacterium]
MTWLASWKARILGSPLARDAVSTTVLSAVGKAAGFLVPLFIAAWFGATTETDALFFAYSMVLFLSLLFAPVIETIIVPHVVQARQEGQDVGAFVGNIMVYGAGAMAVLAAVFLLLVKPVLVVVANFDAPSLALIHRLLLEMAPLVILIVLTSVTAGVLNAYRHFALAALSPMFRAGVNLAVIYAMKDRFGVHAIVWGYVIGELSRFLILLVALKAFRLMKLGWSLRVAPRFGAFVKDCSLQMTGMVAVGFQPIIDKAMASWLGESQVSILHYADTLYMIPVTFVTGGILVAMLSHFSINYCQHGPERLRQDVRKSVRVVMPMVALLTVGFVLLHQPIARLAYGRGALDGESLGLVGWVMACLMLGLLPNTIGRIYLRGLLSLRFTAVFVTYGAAFTVLKVAMNYLLMWRLGVAGIALAGGLTSLFLLFYLRAVFYNRVSSPQPASCPAVVDKSP